MRRIQAVRAEQLKLDSIGARLGSGPDQAMCKGQVMVVVAADLGDDKDPTSAV